MRFKKIIQCISLLLMCSIFCDFTVLADEAVPIESIKISVSNLKMEVGTAQKIKVIVTPANAQSGDYDYISSDSTIVTAGIGTIIANKVGKAVVMVKLHDSEISDTITIEVIESGNANPTSTPVPTQTPTPSIDENNYNEISVRSIEIYDEDILVRNTVEIMQTQTKQFTVKVYPSNATDQSVRWRSYDTDIATVDNNGVVKGVEVGETKIYAIANDNGKSYSITVKIIPYVHYADGISILPDGAPTFRTDETFKMKVDFSPADTTEKGIKWFVYGAATIDQSGNVNIFDKGKITVKAYTQDYKRSATYEFDSTYSDNHFWQIKEDFGVKSNKSIILDFDTDVSSYSASQNIFAGADANSENISIDIKVNGKRIIIAPINGWNQGENYIFIKSNLCDIYGNKLNKNLKYKFNSRMVV